MRSISAVVSLLIVAGLASPSITAQAADAPHPSPDAAILYAHGTGDDEFNGFMNTLVDDGGDDALGSGSLTNSAFTWTITLAPALAGALVLDAESPIVATAYVGASQGVGRVTVSTQLLQGETVVAEGSGQAHTITPATAAPDGLYGTVDWEMTPTVERLAPGADLVWTITASGTASGIFVGIGEGRGRSNIALPIAAVELGPVVRTVYENATGTAFEAELEFANATSDTYIYNWSTQEPLLEAIVGGEVENGTALVEIIDDANESLWDTERGAPATSPSNTTGNASGNDSSPVSENGSAASPQLPITQKLEGTPGNWTIRIAFQNFTGTLRMTIDLPSEPAQITPTDGNGTAFGGNETESGGGLIPLPAHLPLAALAVTSLALYALRRDRRDE